LTDFELIRNKHKMIKISLRCHSACRWSYSGGANARILVELLFAQISQINLA